MYVCKCIKIVPLVLLINACTSGSDSELILPESSDNGTSSETIIGSTIGSTTDANTGANNDLLNTDSTVAGAGVGDAIGATSGVTSGETSDILSADLSADEIGALGSSVGSVVVNTPESPDNNSIVRIPFIDRPNAPKIDGDTLDYISGTELLSGEWRIAAQFNGTNQSLAISQYMFGEPGTNNDNASHHWAAVHDGVYLYVLVVSDDAGEHFQDTNELRKPWKDDSVELFIDGNNSRLNQYDGVDDFHMTINLFSSTNVANSSNIVNPQIRPSDTSATLPSDLIFAAGPEKGPTAANVARGRKDIYEIRIKLSELNIQVGSPFGIELQINDDDNGGSRDAKWGWNHPAGNSSDNDFTWQNPSFMGSAILLQ